MKKNEGIQNAGSLDTVGSRKASGKKTVYIDEQGILVFGDVELIAALDPTAKSALAALVSVGAARVPEGVL